MNFTKKILFVLFVLPIFIYGQSNVLFFASDTIGKQKRIKNPNINFEPPQVEILTPQESKTILLYSLDTFIANGCAIKITADTGNLEIYDIRVLVRLDSRP